MSFKSKITETGTPPMLDINYLPAISKEHQYSLAALYPYATQPNGEFGFQGQIDYKIRKGTALGGKYGTSLTLNYSLAKSIKKRYSSHIANYQLMGWNARVQNQLPLNRRP